DAQSLERRPPGQANFKLKWEHAVKKPGNDERQRAREQQSEQAPDNTERERLRQISSEHMPVVAAQTLKDGDGLYLLLDEDTGHARNPDPSQDQDHQPGKAQLSLHALQYLIREVLHVAEPPYPVMSLRREIALQSFQQRLILPLARFEKARVPHKAAEPGQPRPGRIRVVHHHARERPDIDPVTRHLLDHTTHDECQPSHSGLIADLEVELRQQSGWQERAAALQHRVRVTGAARQPHLAVQRELLLNSLQYYCDGPRVRIVHR